MHRSPIGRCSQAPAVAQQGTDPIDMARDGPATFNRTWQLYLDVLTLPLSLRWWFLAGSVGVGGRVGVGVEAGGG